MHPRVVDAAVAYFFDAKPSSPRGGPVDYVIDVLLSQATWICLFWCLAASVGIFIIAGLCYFMAVDVGAIQRKNTSSSSHQPERDKKRILKGLK